MAIDMKTGKLADIATLDHVNILTDDVDKCRHFYCDVLGFVDGYRPEFPNDGLWLYLEGRPVFHVIEVPEGVAYNTGCVDHIAFRAHHFERFTARLDAHGVEWKDRAVPGMDLHQLFIFDPHGVKLEFNFEGMDRPWKALEQDHLTVRKSRAEARILKAKGKTKVKAKAKAKAKGRERELIPATWSDRTRR
ncbi:MAG: hypothetical protein FJX56_05255 [Alphaproteobacteria bacterium]|nr:hypothetical protein [Alphaproteobacteria bacterium]